MKVSKSTLFFGGVLVVGSLSLSVPSHACGVHKEVKGEKTSATQVEVKKPQVDEKARYVLAPATELKDTVLPVEASDVSDEN